MSNTDPHTEEALRLQVDDLKAELRRVKRLQDRSNQRCQNVEDTLEKSQENYNRSVLQLQEVQASNAKLTKERNALEKQLLAERKDSQSQLEERTAELNHAKAAARNAEAKLKKIKDQESTSGSVYSLLSACQRALDVEQTDSKDKEAIITTLRAKENSFNENFAKLVADTNVIRASLPENTMAPPPAPSIAPSERTLADELDELDDSEDESSPVTSPAIPHPSSPPTDLTTTDNGPSATGSTGRDTDDGPPATSLTGRDTDDSPSATGVTVQSIKLLLAKAAEKGQDASAIIDTNPALSDFVQKLLSQTRSECEQKVRSEYEGAFRLVEPPYGEPDFREGRWEPVFDGNRKVMQDSIGDIPNHLKKMWGAPAQDHMHPDIDKKWATEKYLQAGPYDAKQAIAMFPAERQKRLELFWENKKLASQIDQKTRENVDLASQVDQKSKENAELTGEVKQKVNELKGVFERQQKHTDEDDMIIANARKQAQDAVAQLDQKNQEIQALKEASTTPKPPQMSSTGTATTPPQTSSRGTTTFFVEKDPCSRLHVFIRPFILFLITAIALFWCAGYSESERRLWIEANEGARLSTLGHIGYGGRYISELATSTPHTLYVGGANFGYSTTTWEHPWLRLGSNVASQVLAGVGVVLGIMLGLR